MSLTLIGGEFHNRGIKTPKSQTTRPTTAMVRKAVFDICQSEIENALFLDLFAGSGAMGFEALSRGALRSFFIEENSIASRIIAENAALLKAEERVEIIRREGISYLPHLEKRGLRFNIVYIDPPYLKKNLGLSALQYLDTSSLLVEESTVFLEGDHLLDVDQLSLINLKLMKKRVYGNTTLYHFKFSCR